MPAGFDKQYNTILTNDEEKEFQSWKKQYAPKDSGADYDLRGAFKADLKPGADGHWPDTFKKPNHPTFSDESQYAKFGDPGRWEGEKFIPPSENASKILTRIGTRARTAAMELIDRGEQNSRKLEIRDKSGNRRYQDVVGPPTKDQSEWDGVMKEQRLVQEAQDRQVEDEKRQKSALPTLK